ncbi:MAG TPA: CHASE sensor domain-containing protein, partial [Terriglobales bacterium]|nr:CHASE sensor domain-containing protein [Terriglobales bacterium]
MRLASDKLAYKMTVMALLASSMAVATLMLAFLAFDYVSSRNLLQNRLSTLADVVGQNSTAALNFEDRAAAVEVLEALRAEPPVVLSCLYAQDGSLFAEYQRQPGERCPRTLGQLRAPSRTFSAVTRRVERGGEFAGTLYLKSDLRALTQRWIRLLEVTGILLLLALVVGGISGSLLQSRIAKPIYDLARAMKEVT